MNRGVTIAGSIVLVLSLVIPIVMAESAHGWEEGLFFIFVVIPIAGFAGLIGLILLIVGLASGGQQQQQQQVVVVTGGQSNGPRLLCPKCQHLSPGAAKFCGGCGVRFG